MTLTEAAFWTKRFGVIAGIFLVVFIVIMIIIFSAEKKTLPPEYLTANYACTDLKEDFLENKLSIPYISVNPESEMIYELQTDSGKVDQLPSIINVYEYTNLNQSLNSQAEAKILAKKMGFDPDKIVRKGTTDYIWVDNTNGRSLDIKARDLNFVMKTNIDVIRSVKQEKDLPTENEAISLATNSLRSLGVLDEGYTEVKPNIHLIDVNPDGTYSEADSLINAELIRVDFFRKKPMISIQMNIVGAEDMVKSLENKGMTAEEGSIVIDSERIKTYNFSTLVAYTNPVKSNVSVYIGPENDAEDLILPSVYQIDFTSWTIADDSCGTYELVSPSYALEKIQQGEGSLVYLNANDDEVAEYRSQTVKKIVVTNIYITYYESSYEQKYLQPIYLVEGQATLKNGDKADFHIYYPAINYDIVQNKIELPEADTEESTGISFF